MWWRVREGAQSFAGQPQRRTLSQLTRSQPRGFPINIVARHRYYALALGDLYLQHHHGLLAERHFGGRQVEFPHAHETGIVETLNLLAMRKEACAPVLQRLGIVQAQNLDIGDKQARALDRGQARAMLGESYGRASRILALLSALAFAAGIG